MQVVVDARDQLLDLGRRHAVGEQRRGELDLGRLDLAQAGLRGLVGQPLDLLDQPGVGGGERLVEMQHAGEPAAVGDHRHVAQPAPPHEADRLVERLVERDRRDRPAHHERDRLLEHGPAGDLARDVLLGEDADEALGAVHHDRRRRVGGAHPRHDLGDRAAFRHHHRRRRHVIADPPQVGRGLGMRHARPRCRHGVSV